MSKTQQEFIKYVKTFYGEGGIYPDFFAKNRPTDDDYAAAYKQLRELRKKQGIAFDGDTFDRETLRDILYVRLGILTADEVEYKVEA